MISSVVTGVLGALWFYIENCTDSDFNLEPLCFISGVCTIVITHYWPWNPTNKNTRLKDRVSFDYSTNNGIFKIGRGDNSFILNFSKASDTSIHMYAGRNDTPGTKGITLADEEIGRFSNIKDASVFNFNTSVVCVKEGGIAIIKTHNDKFICVQIHDVKDSSRRDKIDEVTFSYVINADGSEDFS